MHSTGSFSVCSSARTKCMKGRVSTYSTDVLIIFQIHCKALDPQPIKPVLANINISITIWIGEENGYLFLLIYSPHNPNNVYMLCVKDLHQSECVQKGGSRDVKMSNVEILRFGSDQNT